MSGLAGILVAGGDDGSASSLLPDFETMMASLGHRGRHFTATWRGAAGFLGALALQTTPESERERQPLEDAESGLVIVWDGRLDNREELLLRLAEPGEQVGDAALVLRAFQRWNENSVSRLLGDFAFLIWDPRWQTLFAARDVFGLRPFFYSASPGRIHFASEVQALARLQAVSPEVDDETVGEYLLEWTDFPRIDRTFYRHIERLPPAHWLRWCRGRLEIERYWRADPGHRARFPHREDYAEEFGRLFKQAVACRLRSSSGVAIFLSAGLDSGAVCAAAAKLAGAGSNVRAYSLAQADARDESSRAARLAQELGVPCERVPFVLCGELPMTASRLHLHSSPLFEEDWTQEENLLRCAEKDGALVALTGDGGDEAFNNPWVYLADLLRSLRWAKLIRELGPSARYHQRTSFEALRLAVRHVAPAAGVRFWRSVRPRVLPAWIDPRFADQIGLGVQLREVRPRLSFGSLSAEAAHHALTRGRMVLKHEQREWLAAQQGVEYRFPFYDRRLIEFLLAIPFERISEDGLPKSILRTTPGLLPSFLAAQSEKVDQAGLTADLYRRQLGGALRALFEEPPPRAAGYVRFAEARRICAAFLAGDDSRQKLVWTLACFFLWIRSAGSGSGTPARK